MSKRAEPQPSKNTKPEIARAIEIACKRLSGKALQVLTKAMDDSLKGLIDIRWGIQASTEVLNRGFGRARQQIEANINVEGGEEMIEALRSARLRAGIVSQVATAIEDAIEEKPTLQ